MSFRRTRRYPEINSSNNLLTELPSKWGQLVRELNTRDQEPIPYTDIFGRNIGVGGTNLDNVVFVTAGTSLPNTPTADYWYVYEYDIPRDVGMVYVEPINISAGANIQIETYLPPAQPVESRTISFVFDNPTSIAYGSFNLAVFPTSGGTDTISYDVSGSSSRYTFRAFGNKWVQIA